MWTRWVVLVSSRWLIALVVVAGCRWRFDALADASGDIAPDAPPWSTPIAVPFPGQDGNVSSTLTEMIYLDTGLANLRFVTRPTRNDPWGAPQSLPVLASVMTEANPRLSVDDLTLYFLSDRAGSQSDDIWFSTRTAIGAAWSTPQPLVEVNTADEDRWFSPCAGGHYVMTRAVAAGGGDLFQGTLGGGPPTKITELDQGGENGARLMPDCLTMYYQSTVTGQSDIWVTQRTAVGDVWQTPVLFELSDPVANDEDPWVSVDGSLVVFSSNRASTALRIYTATR